VLFYLRESSGKATKVSFLKNPALLYNCFLGKISFLFSGPLQKSFLIALWSFHFDSLMRRWQHLFTLGLLATEGLGPCTGTGSPLCPWALAPFSLVPQQNQPCSSPMHGGCGAKACSCFLGCLADRAFSFAPLRETLPMLAWMYKYSCCLLPCYSRKAFNIDTQGISTILLSMRVVSSPPWSPAPVPRLGLRAHTLCCFDVISSKYFATERQCRVTEVFQAWSSGFQPSPVNNSSITH